jgi:uncharacterized coiled-coil protein SlyX
MDKIQLGTRIPKDLDIQIENAARHRRVKKQELVVQLLRFGLATVENLPDLPREDQLNGSRLNQGSHSFSDAESSSPAHPFSSISNLEERFAHLESDSAVFSHQLAEVNKLIIELQTGSHHLKKPTEQGQKLNSTLITPENEDVNLNDKNQGDVLLSKDSLNLPPVPIDLEKQVGKNAENLSWLTIKEVHELAKTVGYKKSYSSFRVTMVEGVNAEWDRLELGIELDTHRRTTASTKHRSIRLNPDGKMA